MVTPIVTLTNGVEIPQVGLGVFLMTDEEETVWALKHALKVGYRHFDTAAVYGNEAVLGQTLKDAGIAREELFLTSKVWNDMQGYEKTKQAFLESLEKLQTDYLDLYLIHWHGPYVKDTWRAMEELYQAGKVKAIGVSNFSINHLEAMKEYATIMPMVNQVETHPYFPQDELRAYLEKENIRHESWGPLSQGKSDLLLHPLLAEIGEKYGKTPAQVVLRWHIDRGSIVIPKSVNPGRIHENFELFDFKLNDEDLVAIAKINLETRYGRDPENTGFEW
ncbi:aldo/keto reductase [Jeotgalibaca sp. A127]|uniref:aldo/keto reductase n=1 Tax=Jeotgalibaca sp. A127 TaxID=3457324 RepID=UPI003FD61A3D